MDKRKTGCTEPWQAVVVENAPLGVAAGSAARCFTVEEREAALAKVEPFQQGDFEAMYRIMGERPMTIRYLDPPLHEFLPTKDEDIKELAADMGMTFDDLKNVVASLHEFNPMMGHRGCRLAVKPLVSAEDTRGPRSRPITVAPIKQIFGFSSLNKLTRIEV